LSISWRIRQRNRPTGTVLCVALNRTFCALPSAAYDRTAAASFHSTSIRRQASPVASQAKSDRHPPSNTPCSKPSHQHNTASVIERTYPHSFLPNSQRLRRECRDLRQDSGPARQAAPLLGKIRDGEGSRIGAPTPVADRRHGIMPPTRGRLVEPSNSLDDLASEWSASMACAAILAGRGGRQFRGRPQRWRDSVTDRGCGGRMRSPRAFPDSRRRSGSDLPAR